ncbi:MAG TPA: LytTR family DNA-binding domain-containing protein [Vicinamibacterales bacterium]|jgi:two-component system LytT family response regulator|nr:LytTR family DNA-binding domain-containing protein [Vicinamibacterales bacterium]
MTIRALVVDDEAPARRRIRRLLVAEPDVRIAGECVDGLSAIQTIARDHPDLVFLDVQMPEHDGFDVVQTIPPGELPEILFVTAFDRYALRAFDVHAVDYLLKPFTVERFRTALDRARARLAARVPDPALTALAEALRSRTSYISRVIASSGRRSIVLDVASVDWMEAADNYIRLHVESREYLLRETLATLERRLDPYRFVRIHRSAIVAVDRIATLAPTSHGDAEIILRDGTRLAATRTWRDRLHRVLTQSRSV